MKTVSEKMLEWLKPERAAEEDSRKDAAELGRLTKVRRRSDQEEEDEDRHEEEDGQQQRGATTTKHGRRRTAIVLQNR